MNTFFYGHICTHCVVVAVNADETACETACFHTIPVESIIDAEPDEEVSGTAFQCADCGEINLGDAFGVDLYDV